MSKLDRKNRFSLTILFAVVILVFLILTLTFSVVIGYILVETGIITLSQSPDFSPMNTFLFLSVISLILGSIVATIAGKYPLKPVNKIISQLNRLAAGDFKARLEFSGPLAKHPAVYEVTSSFNKMAEELDKTEMLRSDFINNFSHEFKTPIVSIAGFAKLLKRGNLTEQERAEYLDIIEEESLRLSAMATNVLNLTKYENQTILTDISEYNLSEQIRSALLKLELKWSQKNIDFDLDFGEYDIRANKDMLSHVWINLLDNAIKFSENGSIVGIGITEKGENYYVSVSNNCPDIPKEAIDRIFHKFYQADESHSSEGNGIGLALVKSVSELHGGGVAVISEGGRTTFTVTLPKKQ